MDARQSLDVEDSAEKESVQSGSKIQSNWK